MDRLALNAMLERLLDSDGHDEEARHVLAAFATDMERSSPWRFYSHISTPGDRITGQTNLGTLEVESDRPMEREMSLGAREERIGHYKLIRQGGELEITHFWKSDAATASEEEMAPAWRLSLDGDGKPFWFGEKALKHLFTLPLFGRFVQIVVNRELFVRRWGPDGPGIRRGALSIQMEITTG